MSWIYQFEAASADACQMRSFKHDACMPQEPSATMTQLYKASGLFATKPLKVCHSAIKQCSKCTTAEVASPDHHKISIMKDMLRFAVLWTVTTSELHSIGKQFGVGHPAAS